MLIFFLSFITDLLIRVHSVGICGTDIHFWAHGGMGPFTLQQPHILGHETSGTVEAVGSNVTNFQIGDHVTLEPAIPCNACDWCLGGENNLCPHADDKVVGSPPKDGCFQRWYVHPASLCHKLPKNMTLEEGALVEPLACVVHAVQRAQITVGQNVLVCGAGPMGMLCALAAKVWGAGKVLITDINPKRLEQGKKCSDLTLLVDTKVDHATLSQQVQNVLGGPPHITLECTGVESSLRLALTTTRPGGKVALVGLGPQFVSVPLCMSSLRQVDIVGCARYNNTFKLAIELIASKRLPVLDTVVTHRFPMKDVVKAFETVISGEGNKVLIQF